MLTTHQMFIFMRLLYSLYEKLLVMKKCIPDKRKQIIYELLQFCIFTKGTKKIDDEEKITQNRYEEAFTKLSGGS